MRVSRKFIVERGNRLKKCTLVKEMVVSKLLSFSVGSEGQVCRDLAEDTASEMM